MTVVASLQTLTAGCDDVVTNNISTAFPVILATLVIFHTMSVSCIGLAIHDMQRLGFGIDMYECDNPYP